MNINPDALAAEALALCDKIAAFSASAGGIKRFCLTPHMAQLHDFLSVRFSDTYATEKDRMGNILFRARRAGKRERLLLIGSHLDTVDNAGRYDGVLGMVIGLLMGRECQKQRGDTQIDVAGFADEEGGRFGGRFLGSLNFIGELPDEQLALTDDEGITLKHAIAAAAASRRPNFCQYLRATPPSLFIEMHMEQGTELHRHAKNIGIISAISGQTVLRLRFTGRAAHAVSKWRRRNALLAACQLVVNANALALEEPDLHLTIGSIHNPHNLSNVVSDYTSVDIDIRHLSDSIRHNVTRRVMALARGIAASQQIKLASQTQDRATVAFSKPLLKKLRALAERHQILYRDMTSYAGHDSLVISKVLPSLLLLMRDRKGISHAPEESANKTDVSRAFNFLNILIENAGALNSEQ